MKKLLQIILIGILITSCNSKKKVDTKTDSKIEKTITESIKKELKNNLKEKEPEKDWKKYNLERIEKENIAVLKKDIDTSDLYYADNRNVIFISPSQQEIKNMKKKYGEEDFYIVADDINFYRYQAYKFIKSRTMESFNTDKRFIRFIMKSRDTVYVDTEKVESKWTIILCDGYDKPYSSEINQLELNFEELDE